MRHISMPTGKLSQHATCRPEVGDAAMLHGDGLVDHLLVEAVDPQLLRESGKSIGATVLP